MRWRALRHHSGRARGDRLAHKAKPVVLEARHRDKQIALFDGAAIGADAHEIERRETRIAACAHALQILHEVLKLHSDLMPKCRTRAPHFVSSCSMSLAC